VADTPEHRWRTGVGDPPAVVDTIYHTAVLPVVVMDAPSGAAPLRQALVAGGLNCAEVTLRTPDAESCIRRMAEDPDFLVGVGTVVAPEQVERAVDAGASFIVSPGFSARVVQRAQELGVPIFPGVATATEIQQALDAGLDIVKFFPAQQLGGPAMLRALAAPFPNIRFIPTGGISAESLPRYIEVPAVLAVGGSWIVAPSLIRENNWAEITRLTDEARHLASRTTLPGLALGSSVVALGPPTSP
jgi:2-dehydro-3-deoxyphosphogluconate aldolase/(4S)-4-hydroxy-2-oxoglutarate aldolase